jgi:glycosyltransferase involved in cell wall biosynthesis
MAAKLPVVAFADAGGVPDMLAEGGGKIVPYGDTAAFAEAVCQYLVDEEKRRSEGALGARAVKEKFDFDDYLCKIEAVLLEHS